MDSLFKINKNDIKGLNTDGYSKQAENIWSMLDDMAATDPNSYKNFIEKTLKEGKEALKPPVPNMCVKTNLKKPKSIELYINFFSWQRVPAPKSDQDPIPVCGSKLELNEKEALINLGFNPEVLDKFGKSASNELEREMLINLGFQFVESQNECKINQDNFEIIKMEHFGDLKKCIDKLTNKTDTTSNDHDIANQIINDEDKNIPGSILTKIANINLKPQTSTNNNNNNDKKNLIEEMNKTGAENKPNYEEKISNLNNDPTKAIYELKINLVGVNSMSECNLDIDQDYLTLNTTSNIYSELKISLNDLKSKYNLQTETIDAKFVKKTSILKIKITLLVK